MLPQCVFEIKPTKRGFFYCIAYLAVGDKPRPVAVSRFMYVSPNAALNDVLDQIKAGPLAVRPTVVPSAAAGGVR